MARPKAPGRTPATLAASAQVFRQGPARPKPHEDRRQLAQRWQIEAYRHVNICGEARYAATLFANIASRAEIGISEPHALGRKASWVISGEEVEVLNELVPTVRDRARLIRDYMLHRTIAGECYLIGRDRVETDPDSKSREPIWEIVAVTEIQRVGDGSWRVRLNNDHYVSLSASEPVIRLWNPDPENRMEAWSPFRSLMSTLNEIEWLTKHIFTQVRSRMMSAGVWFMPDNVTFPEPPASAVQGGAAALATMNDAERFMASLAASSMEMLDAEEVAFPTIVMADPAALAQVDQSKLIKFWSEIDDKAMTLRSDAVRRFALGMDLPPEQVLGSSGLAVTGGGGSAGSVNHWGVWANEEQTISAHIEPALDDLVAVLTSAVLRNAVEGTDKVVGYDTATLRLRQDRSKEAMEWYDRGILKAEVALRETGFDPDLDMMDETEHRIWLLNKLVAGSPSPEQMQAAFLLLTGKDLPVVEHDHGGVSGNEGEPKGIAGPNEAPSLEDHPYEGPPREQHDHSPAPFTALHASAEVLVLRALEKAGNRLLNDGKRGKDRDRTTPPHLAHLAASVSTLPEFDFTLLPTVMAGESAIKQALVGRAINRYCENLYSTGTAYSREGLIDALKGL